jgi:hypothetical protein
LANSVGCLSEELDSESPTPTNSLPILANTSGAFGLPEGPPGSWRGALQAHQCTGRRGSNEPNPTLPGELVHDLVPGDVAEVDQAVHGGRVIHQIVVGGVIAG